MINKHGDMVHPCLTPSWGLNHSEISPFFDDSGRNVAVTSATKIEMIHNKKCVKGYLNTLIY